jgi:hypothetical protein
MSLAVPDTARPNNLHYAPGVKATLVESDMFDICKRVQEISPRLFILLLHDDNNAKFAIMEKCQDGVDRLVMKRDVLDGRVVERLQFLMKVPLAARMDALEKEEARLQAHANEKASDELYERLGAPMLRQLRHDGFADDPVSRPTVAVATGGKKVR